MYVNSIAKEVVHLYTYAMAKEEKYHRKEHKKMKKGKKC